MLLLLLACRLTDADVDAALDPDGDGFGPEEDCAPRDAAVYPGAEEVWYDGVDQSCSGNDFDQDGDGFASAEVANASGVLGDDCDDLNGAVNPGAEEIWYDAIDQNCDGANEYDQDGDGFRSATDEQPDGSLGDDCDDTNSTINPSASEICNTGLDEDCSGDDNGCSLSGEILIEDALYTYVSRGGVSFGSALAHGDWNSDGFVDLAVGASFAENSSAITDAGGVHVIYGPLPQTMTFDENEGVAFEGVNERDFLGQSLGGGGDLDGDGVEDLLMGAHSFDDGGMYDNGTLALIYGGPTWSGVGPATLADSIFYGDMNSDLFGMVTRFIGDLDGDGYDEIAVGAVSTDLLDYNSGSVYIIAGSATKYAGAMTVGDVAGVTLVGDSGDFLGGENSISDAFDLDGDGLSDIAVGAPEKATIDKNSGIVYLIYGNSSIIYSGIVSVSESADATFQPLAANDLLGKGVGAPGDVDGDGYDDLLLGAVGYDDPAGDLLNSGGAFLINGGSVHFSGDMAVVTTAMARVTGAASHDGLGTGLNGGDLNDDGFNDLVLGAHQYDHDGVSTGGTFMFLGPVSGALVATDADAIFVGPNTGSAAGMGNSATVFDANGDGVMDVFIGASDASMVYGYLGGSL